MILTALVLSTALAWAAPDSELKKSALDAQKDCGNFVRFDDKNLFLGFGAYKNGFEEPRKPIPAYFRVVPMASRFSGVDLATDDAAIDVVTYGDRTYLLTFSAIEEWDLARQQRVAKYPTYFFNGDMEYRQHARAFARYNNKLIIAHGRLGVSIFDLDKKRITNQFKLVQNRMPLESQAMSVAIAGKLAYVLVDSFTLVPPEEPRQPFRGLVVIDLETEKVVRELEGLDPGTDAVLIEGDRLIISYMGIPIWKYNLSSLTGRKMPEPVLRLSKFTMPGHPYGTPAIDDQNYYTCFRVWPTEPGRGDFKNITLSLDRAANRLN